MASHLGCFVSFPVNRILRNKRHFRPQNRLKLFAKLLLSLSLFCFYCKANSLRSLPLRKTNEFSSWLQDANGTSVQPQRSLSLSLSLESSVCFACELHVYGHFFGMSLPVSVHVCSCCSGVNWKATTEVAFFYLPHKKLNSQALPIVVVIACVAHTPRPQNVARLCGLLQRGSGLKWNFVGNCKSDLNVCRCFYFFFCWVYFELDREIC